MPTIYVSRKGRSLNLKLRDDQGHKPGNSDLTTDVNPNDQITWKLDTNSGLAAITGIRYAYDANNPCYRHSVELLQGEPVENQGEWTATIKGKSPGKGKSMHYMIGFKLPGDETEYWEDPKLQMKS